MDINILRIFLKIADGATFSDVAEDEHMSQSSISKSIRHLEDEIGVKLFDRTYRSVILTNAGVILRNNLHKLLPEFDKMLGSVQSFSNKFSIRCGIVPPITIWHMQESLSLFEEIYTDISLTMSTPKDTSSALRALRGGLLDAVIAHLPVSEELYNSKVIHNDNIVAVFSKKHRFAGKEYITIHDLLSEQLVLASNTSSTFHSLQSTPAFQPILENVVETVGPRETAIAKVYSGDYVSLFHESSMKNRVGDDVQFAPVVYKSSPPPDLAIITMKSVDPSDEINLLSDHLCNTLN